MSLLADTEHRHV